MNDKERVEIKEWRYQRKVLVYSSKIFMFFVTLFAITETYVAAQIVMSIIIVAILYIVQRLDIALEYEKAKIEDGFLCAAWIALTAVQFFFI